VKSFSSILIVFCAVVVLPAANATTGQPKLAPGPWEVIARGHTTDGRQLVVTGSWTDVDAGGVGGVVIQAPNPKRMAFSVSEPPAQHSAVTWTVGCFPRNEIQFTLHGTIRGRGSFVRYPSLPIPSRRTSCNLYLTAKPADHGSLKATLYAY
jgi:hypothetical protein